MNLRITLLSHSEFEKERVIAVLETILYTPATYTLRFRSAAPHSYFSEEALRAFHVSPTGSLVMARRSRERKKTTVSGRRVCSVGAASEMNQMSFIFTSAAMRSFLQSLVEDVISQIATTKQQYYMRRI